MGHLFQAECWEKHPSVGVHWFIMAKEIDKENDIWKGKMTFLTYVFMKIREIRIKGV